MPTLQDPEFGQVTLRRSQLARAIRLKVDARGALSITLPKRAPLFLARQLLDDSRASIRNSLRKISIQAPVYQHGDIIGKVHRLRIEQRDQQDYSHRVDHTELVVCTPIEYVPTMVQQEVRTGMSKALRMQARAYLPRRLQALAAQHGFAYQKLRFSSAGTRWGSCSSQGTISLNIWLMQLPFELIDYVMLHELCHTRHMNHSERFWGLLSTYVPQYKDLRHRLKRYHPYG